MIEGLGKAHIPHALHKSRTLIIGVATLVYHGFIHQKKTKKKKAEEENQKCKFTQLPPHQPHLHMMRNLSYRHP
jgi:hypothetical protein